MIKFEVGKVYEATNILGVKVYRKVITRSEKFLITYTRNNDGGIPVWNGEGCHLISVVNDVEVCMDAFYNQKLSADKEAKPEEVKEEDKEEEKQNEQEENNSDDWIEGKEYEAVCLQTNQKFKVKLEKDDKDDCYPLTFRSDKLEFICYDLLGDYKDIAFAIDCGNKSDKCVVVFKHGIKSILDWEEVKEEREHVCFEVGKEYKDKCEDIWVLKAIFNIDDEKNGVFYNKETKYCSMLTINKKSLFRKS